MDIGLQRPDAEAGLNPDRVRSVTTAAFPRPAPRPTRSVLSHDRWRAAGLPPLDHWEPMLERALQSGGLQALRV